MTLFYALLITVSGVSGIFGGGKNGVLSLIA